MGVCYFIINRTSGLGLESNKYPGSAQHQPASATYILLWSDGGGLRSRVCGLAKIPALVVEAVVSVVKTAASIADTENAARIVHRAASGIRVSSWDRRAAGAGAVGMGASVNTRY